MSTRVWRHQLPSALLALALLTGACRPRNKTGETGSVSGNPTDTALTAPSPGAATAASTGKLTDANIVALLDEVNAADSTAGALAVTKATSPDVKQFGRLMMSDHHALRLQGQQLAKKQQITPSPPADDSVAPLAQQEKSALESTPKGPEFDRTYIDQEVGVHRAVKDLLEKSKGAAENDQLKDLIGKAQPVIQKHLDQAELLQKKLTAST
jgi:putative membrane protein